MSTSDILPHENLDAYRVALEFCRLAWAISRALPRAKGQLGDQLTRASESIVLCIAEGAGLQRHSAAQLNFFRIARGSALECAAVLDVVAIRGVSPKAQLSQGRALVVRLVQMLTGMARSG